MTGRLPLIALGMALAACADPIDRQIDDLIEGGEAGEEARIALNLAKGDALGPLIQAFRDQELPARARMSLADALYRLHLREKSQVAFDAMIGGLDDPEPLVRLSVARILGDIGEREAGAFLLATLESEEDPRVQLEILRAFEVMTLETINATNPTLDLSLLLEEDEVQRFTAALTSMTATHDSLALAKQEWMENIAETMAVEARKSLLRGDLGETERILLEARQLVPDSRNLNFQLGKFYYENGDTDKGLDIVSDVGLVAHVERLAQPPWIDGDVDDPAWADTEPLTDFYQLLARMNPYPAEGRSEIYLGYLDQTLYVGVKGYEPRTDNLRAEATQRDAGDVWQDDCVEIYLDPNHDSRTYYQLIVNSLGTLEDRYNKGGTDGSPDPAWNADLRAATQVADNYWSMEMEIPIADMHESRASSGSVWGFNIAQVRITNLAESAQWAPTYGWSQQPDRFGFLVFR